MDDAGGQGGKAASGAAGGDVLAGPAPAPAPDASTGQESSGAVPTAVQVVASMVDSALQVRSERRRAAANFIRGPAPTACGT